MDISLDLYRIFEAAARHGSFTGAARELYITQPAVSQAVRRLEDAFGAPLFTRGARGNLLTNEGAALYGYVLPALNLLKAGERRLGAGELRVGAGDTVSKWLLPVIERFHALCPEVSLSLTNRTSSDTLSLLREGRIDLAFVNLPISAEGVVFEECLAVHDVFIAGERFAELKYKRLTPEELSKFPLIMLERSSNTRRRVDRYFEANGVTPNVGIELGSHDLLAGYAGIGLGVACVIREFCPPERGLFELDVYPAPEPRAIGVCRLEGLEPSPSARRFVELLRELNPRQSGKRAF